MNAARTAAVLRPSEFITLCCYLDREYKKDAKRFEVLQVIRDDYGVVEITVCLLNNSRITLNRSCFVKK